MLRGAGYSAIILIFPSLCCSIIEMQNMDPKLDEATWDSLTCAEPPAIFGTLVRSLDLRHQAKFFSGSEFIFLPNWYIFGDNTSTSPWNTWSSGSCKFRLNDFVFQKFGPEKNRAFFTIINAAEFPLGTGISSGNCDKSDILGQMAECLKDEMNKANILRMILAYYDQEISKSLETAVENNDGTLQEGCAWVGRLLQQHFIQLTGTGEGSHVYLMLLRDDPRLRQRIEIDHELADLPASVDQSMTFPVATEPCTFQPRSKNPAFNIPTSPAASLTSAFWIYFGFVLLTAGLICGSFILVCYRFHCFGLKLPYLFSGTRGGLKFHRIGSSTGTDEERVISDYPVEIESSEL